MDWNEHMKRVAVNWLSKGNNNLSLEPEMLMLFGNPDLFQEEQFNSYFESIEPLGVFYRGVFDGSTVTYCRPLFGAPIVSLYTEAAALMGVKKIVACGYAGGVTNEVGVGNYVVPSSAYGLDGCTQNYSPRDLSTHSSAPLTSRLCSLLDFRGASYAVGPIVSIDTLMLENDAMIEDFASKGYYAVDLETACLYAVANRLGLEFASVHIVSDSPKKKDVDEKLRHEASFREQIEVAIRGLIGS